MARTAAPLTADAERDESDSYPLGSILAVTGFRTQVDDLIDDLIKAVHQHISRLRADCPRWMVARRTYGGFS